jgi:hypothetical protein
MSKEFLPISSVSDSQSWNMYKNTEHRWTFNKLELALLQGLHAGPAAVPPEKLPYFVNWLDDEKTTCFNIEIKGGKIIEIHLRSGDEIEDNFEINDKIFPIWVDEDNDYIKNIEEPDPEMTLFKAHGHLSIVRDGFHLEKINKDTC